MTTVEKIHNEFFTAGDKLIKAAKAIIAKGILETSNAPKLIALGFTQCQEVKKYQSVEALRNHGLLAEEYAQKYPLNKFITRKQVDQICKKYKLLLGSVSIYKGCIPTKSIQEILSFKVDESDLEESLFGFQLFSWNLLIPGGITKTEEPKPQDNKIRSMSICAPKTMMNMEGQKIVGNEIVPKDPIVLHPVKGGFLIVAAWGGPEASDKLVVNQKMN